MPNLSCRTTAQLELRLRVSAGNIPNLLTAWINVPDHLAIGRFSGDHHWAVWVIPEPNRGLAGAGREVNRPAVAIYEAVEQFSLAAKRSPAVMKGAIEPTKSLSGAA